MNNLERKAEEILNSRGAVIIERINILKINFYILEKNFEQLVNLHKIVNKQDILLHLWDLKNKSKLDSTLNEVVRLFHNFLASAKSLVDHTRVLINYWYADDEMLKKYQKEIDERFKNNEISGFIEALRNFNLHYSLPVTQASLQVKLDKGVQQSSQFDFVLTKTALLKWSNWSSKGKPFLSSSPEEIDLIKLSRRYFEQIESFYDWLIEEILNKHREEIQDFFKNKRELFDSLTTEEKAEYGL